MKLINFGFVTRIRLEYDLNGLALKSFCQEHRTLKAPHDYTASEKDLPIYIDQIDPSIPCRFILKGHVMQIVPMGYFDFGKSDKSFLMEVHKYPIQGTYLKLKVNMPESGKPYIADAITEGWFEKAMKIFNYIPVAIFDYITGKIRFTSERFKNVAKLEEYWNAKIKEPVFEVMLDVYGLDTGINSYEVVDIRDLRKVFLDFVKFAEMEVIGKPRYNWLDSHWSIPFNLFRKHVEITYPKEDPNIIENQNVDVEKFQNKVKELRDNA